MRVGRGIQTDWKRMSRKQHKRRGIRQTERERGREEREHIWVCRSIFQTDFTIRFI